MNLNHLRYFVIIAELKSFTAASEKLSITQPTLSVSVQKLESSLGVKLLNRTKKTKKNSISLTNSGKHFLDKAKDILAQLESVKIELHHNCADTKILRLGTLPSVSTDLARKFIISLRNAFANITVEQVTGSSLELENWLNQGDIDVALNVFSDEYGQVNEVYKTSKILYDRRYLVAIAEKHPLAKKASLSIEELNGIPYIDRMGCEVRCDLQKAFRERNICPKIIGKTQHGFLADCLVASGAGLAIVPNQREIAGVVTLPFSDFSIKRLVGLKWQASEDSEIVEFCRQFSPHVLENTANFNMQFADKQIALIAN